MKKKRFLTLIGSVCLAVMLLVPLAVSCGPATPEEAAEEIAALESKLAAEKAKSGGLEDDIADLEDEITTLKAPAEVYEWRCQYHEAPALIEATVGPWRDLIYEMSDGRIEIKLFSAGELVPDDEILGAVAAQTLDLGIASGGYYPKELPVGVVDMGLPFSWLSFQQEQGFYAFNDYQARNKFREVYAKHNVYYLSHMPNAAYTLFTTKSFKTLDDLRELKLRATGGTGMMLEGVGVSTMYLPFVDLAPSLEKGIIDGCIWGGPSDIYEGKLYENLSYMVQPAVLNPICNGFLINLELYNSLPDDLKEIMEAASEWSGTWVGLWFLNKDLTAIGALYDAGLERIDMDEETVTALKESAATVWDELAAEDSDVAELIDMLKEYLALL